MAKIQVFDPAMCCSTGVCGPDVDAALPRFAADLEWLKGRGVTVERFGLAQDTRAFLDNELVTRAINQRGQRCLPLILVDGQVVSEGRYPTREQLATFAGVDSGTTEGATARRSLNIHTGQSAAPDAQPCCTPRPGGSSSCG